MGHLIAAKALGFRTGFVRVEMIEPGGGYNGGAELWLNRPLLTNEGIRLFIEQRVIVLWAGALAEELQGNAVDQDRAGECLHSERGYVDHAKVTELLNLLCNFTRPEAVCLDAAQERLKEVEHELWPRAVAVVESHAAIIHGMAGRLAQMIKMANIAYTLTKAEIDSTPNIVKAFDEATPFR